MLAHHESIVVPQESLLFKMFWSSRFRYGDLSLRENQTVLLRDMLATRIIGYWEPKPTLRDAASLLSRPGFGGAVEALILATAQGRPVTHWGEKSPGHVFYWRAVKECFPEAKVVHILRDGRDVALSLLKARMGPKSFYAAARLWRDYVNEMQRVRDNWDPRRFVQVRYEDLLAEPETTLRSICDTLDVSFSDRMLRFFENKSRYVTDAVNSANLHHRVLSDNKDKWRTAMSPSQLAEFEVAAFDCLRANGYETVSDGRALSPARIAFIQWISSPIRRLKSRARDIQGQREFLNLTTIKTRRAVLRLIGRVTGSASAQRCSGASN